MVATFFVASSFFFFPTPPPSIAAPPLPTTPTPTPTTTTHLPSFPSSLPHLPCSTPTHFLARRTSLPFLCCVSVDPDDSPPPFLEDLHVPDAWGTPAAAAQESDWLREALHQWLDNEYCPEPANDEISRRCAKVYYYCLMEKQHDMGDILMQMVRDLETFSFKESFHGAFTSANAAVDLITTRIRTLENKE